MTRVYVAHALTGRDADDVLRESMTAYWAMKSYGVTAIDPAVEEGVKPGQGTLQTPLETLRGYWKRDKALIRSCHVLLDLTGQLKSAGVEQEIGYMRFFLWRPVVRVWPGLSDSSIARFEGDVVVGNIEAAAALIAANWGTPWKRLWWRMKMYFRSRLRALAYEAGGWLNALH